MALLNQGFVRTLNLFEAEDANKIFENLADGVTIPADLQVFAGNTTNITRLIFKPGDVFSTATNPSDPDAGTVFEQRDKLATFGNGDPVKLRVAQSIFNITRNLLDAQQDALVITYSGAHGIPQVTFTQTEVYVSLEGTLFANVATALNQKFYRAQYSSTTQLRIFDVGYKQKLELIDPNNPSLGFEDVNDPGEFVQVGDIGAPTDYFPYSTSQFFPFPTVLTGDQVSFDQTYYIVFSDAVTTFRVGRNYSRTQLIQQLRFNTSELATKNIIFERSNATNKKNLENLARPVFEDEFFTFTSGALNRTFGDNFDDLESYLDNANFFRQKKFLTSEDNLFDVTEIGSEGVITTTDTDIFNSEVSDLFQDTSPGVYILNKDASSIIVDPPVITKLRAYSDNTQPWSLLAGPPDILEYQVLRNPITNLPRSASAQEMQIGNLSIGDTSNGYIEIASGNTRTPGEYFSGVQILSGTQRRLDLSDYGISNAQVYAIDTQKYRFTHKIDCIIDGEFYSLCLTKDIGNDNGTGAGSDPLT
jgi:hypothetical protein